MNRRALLALIGTGLGVAGARTSGAQPPVLGLLDSGERREWWAAFRQQLRDLGYVRGQNIAFEERFAAGRFEKLPALAQELVRLKVAVIVTSGSVAAQAAAHATPTIPVVFATGSDAMLGLVASLAHPGGNVTGTTSIATGLTGKRFEVLRETLPKMSRMAVLWHRDNPSAELALREIDHATRPSKVAVKSLGVKSVDEVAGAFSTMAQERVQAVLVVSDPFFFSERRRMAEITIRQRLPNIHSQSEFVDAGGLLSYGPSYADLFRRAAVYVDKILKGAKPAELPIEQPTKLDLVINARTAKAIGLIIPPVVLLRADRVIE